MKRVAFFLSVHECADTFAKGGHNGDNETTVLDIDYILH
jgi:hypothetical protein